MNPKVLIPMIRKVMPGLMAQQITGVQPMTSITGRIFTENYSFGISYNVKYWPHQFHLDKDWGEVMLAERWCYQNFKSRNWKHSGHRFVFKREADATLFALKWL